MRKGKESVLPGIWAHIHGRWVLYPFCKDRLCQYPCLLGKNKQRQSYYLQGLCSTQASWPLQADLGTPCLSGGCRKAQARLHCHLVGRHVTEHCAICMVLCLSQNCHCELVWGEKRRKWIKISGGIDLRILWHMLMTMSQGSWVLLSSLLTIHRVVSDKFPHLSVSHL